MMTNYKHSLGALAIAAGALLGGCGGGGGSGGSTTTTASGAGSGGSSGGGTVTTTVSGVVSAGLVSGATVTATCGTGTTPIGVSSTPTNSDGAYVISLTQDCVDMPVLLTARPSNNGMTVADEFLGAIDNQSIVPTVASGAAWTLRTYYTLIAGQANVDVSITPLTDMAVELVDAVRTGQNRFLAGTPAIAGQPTYPLSTALIASADAVIRVMLLGDDPSAIGAIPKSPASINLNDAGEVQLAVVLASLSMWANNNAASAPWSVAPATSATCGDPLVCGGDASPLAALEAALVSDLGSSGHLVMTDYDPDAQGNPRYLTYNQLSADASATLTTSPLPANALQGIALTIENTTTATGPTTVTPVVAQCSAANPNHDPTLTQCNSMITTSSLLRSSWAYITNGYVAPGF
jgi:hypothetical protein